MPSTPLTRLVSVIAVGTFLVIAALVGLQLHNLADPYVRDVLVAEGDAQRGNEIFVINCAGCHGLHGAGNVGPSLEKLSQRRSQVSIIKQVTGGKTPPMPKFQPKPQEMADLLGYLETL